MASSGARRGIDLKLYRNTGTYGSPTWTLVSNVQDLNKDAKRTKIDSNTRGFGGWKIKVAGEIEFVATWTMIYDLSDAALVAIMAAFYDTSSIAANTIEFGFADGLVSGSNWRMIRATCGVFDASEKEDLDGLDVVSVEVAPTYNANATPYPTISTG